MLGYIRKFWKASKVAWKIDSLLASSLYFARDGTGELSPKLEGDDFVLAYIFGVIASCLEPFGVTDTEEMAILVRTVYKNLFPNHGLKLAETCSAKAALKDEDFMRDMDLGFTEMQAVVNSGGENIPKSLLNHISTNYGDWFSRGR